jgi:PleD family two-component response regulator
VGEFVAGKSIDEFIQRVDNALYGAKNAGRNRVEIAELQEQAV